MFELDGVVFVVVFFQLQFEVFFFQDVLVEYVEMVVEYWWGEVLVLDLLVYQGDEFD